MRWSAEWIDVPRSTTRAANTAIGSGALYLFVSYMHFWSRSSGQMPWPTGLLVVTALTSIWCGYSLHHVRPNSWGFAHTFYAILGVANIALVPLMFGLPVLTALLGLVLCVVILVSLQTDDSFALAEPEAQAQRPEPVIFKRRQRQPPDQPREQRTAEIDLTQDDQSGVDERQDPTHFT